MRTSRFTDEQIIGIVREYEAGAKLAEWTSPLGVEGSLTNPSTPGGRHGGEANPTPVYG